MSNIAVADIPTPQTKFFAVGYGDFGVFRRLGSSLSPAPPLGNPPVVPPIGLRPLGPPSATGVIG